MDIAYISSLIELFEASSLSELRLSEGEQDILLKRELTIAQGPGRSTAAEPAATVEQTAPQASDTIIIPSPIVGTFYRTPAPDSPPFVEVGDTVHTGDDLCIIEAMKMMNRLEAEFDCEIVAIHANHGDLVEYGAALLEVRRV